MRAFVFAVLIDESNDRNLLNIGYLSSAVKKVDGVRPKVLFGPMADFTDLLNEIVACNPIAVGLSVIQYNFTRALDFARSVKELLPDTKVVLGGLDATQYAEYILRECDHVDIVVLGEGELTLTEVCERLLERRGLEGCRGICYRDSAGNIVKSPRRELVADLDTLDFPDRSFCKEGITVYNVIGSRGCAGTCTYCESNCIFRHNAGPRVRVRSMNNILDEMESMLKDVPFGYILFMDYTFSTDTNNPVTRLADLYHGISKRGLQIQFSMYIRAEQVDETYLHWLLKLREVGLDRIFIGVEFGTQEELTIYRKTATLEDNRRALETLEQYGFLNGSAGVIVDIGFIPFHAYTTFETLRNNIAFLRRFKMTDISVAIQNRMYISGSTPVCKQLDRDGLLLQTLDKPILNPYAYTYQDPRIAKVYSALVLTLARLKLDDIPTKILSNHVAYQKYYTSQFDMREVYGQYTKVSDAVLDILEEIVERVEQGEEYDCESSEIFRGARLEIGQVAERLSHINSIMAKRLLRINKLAIPELYKIYLSDAKKAIEST